MVRESLKLFIPIFLIKVINLVFYLSVVDIRPI